MSTIPFFPVREMTVKSQRGVALFISLIVLVAMTMAAIALVRSVDTATMVAGNLAFRQGATTSGHAGIEAARTWLMANGTLLVNNSTSNGYYATSQDSLDLTGNKTPGDDTDDVGWGGGGGMSQALCLAEDNAGNTVCYIIHRLCNVAGPLNSSTCSTRETTLGGASQGAARQMLTYQEGKWPQAATQAYYRVTVRIAGPRNNISFVQAFLVI